MNSIQFSGVYKFNNSYDSQKTKQAIEISGFTRTCQSLREANLELLAKKGVDIANVVEAKLLRNSSNEDIRYYCVDDEAGAHATLYEDKVALTQYKFDTYSYPLTYYMGAVSGLPQVLMDKLSVLVNKKGLEQKQAAAVDTIKQAGEQNEINVHASTNAEGEVVFNKK